MKLLKDIYLTLFYEVFYLKEDKYKGYFVKKRLVTIILFAPLILPFFVIKGFFKGISLYFSWGFVWYYQWIESNEKKNLSFREKLNIKRRLA